MNNNPVTLATPR